MGGDKMLCNSRLMFLSFSGFESKKKIFYYKYLFLDERTSKTVEFVTKEEHEFVQFNLYDLTLNYNSQYSSFSIVEYKNVA